MGYSRSVATLEKIYPLLQRLEEGEPLAWAVKEGHEHKFAYKVREGLSIAKKNRTLYPRLAAVASKFEIQTQPGRVVADIKPDEENLEVIATDIGQSFMIRGNQTLEVSGAQTPESVVSLWLKHKPPKLHFPEAHLGAKQLLELYKWSRKMGLLFFAYEGSLTIVPDSEDMRELAWRPEDAGLA